MEILMKVFNWYTNSLIFKNWVLTAIFLLILILIMEFIFDKQESKILHFWKFIKHQDQKSKIFYQKKR